MSSSSVPSGVKQVTGVVLGLAALGAVVFLSPPEGLTEEGWRTAGVALLMALLWVSEAVSFTVTALLPLVLFPLLGVASIQETAAPYAHPIIFLFLGGILIALAMEKWNLHRRIALRIIRWMGTRPASIVAGFLLASAFISMWVNNTATAVMMLPIGMSVIGLLHRGDENGMRHFPPALMLAIAFGSSIGGFITLIGTAPNALYAGFVEENYGYSMGFAQWMLLTAPIAVLALPLCWLVLTRVAFRLGRERIAHADEALESEARQLGSFAGPEKVVAVVFALTAVLWISRGLLAGWLPQLSDTVIAMAGGLALFFIPVNFRKREFVMDWGTARGIPWDVLLLIGGGLSLAAAIQGNGVAEYIGSWAKRADFLPLAGVVFVVALLILALTELTSNTATTATFLPIVGSTAMGMGENPMLLGAVATIAASCAFMLPVATPPNAIVFASGRVSLPQMMRAGLWLNVGFLILLTVLMPTWGSWVLGGGR